MTKVNAIISADMETATGNIRLLLKGESPQPYLLELNRACAPPIILALSTILEKSRERFKEKAEFQPATLTEARKISDPSGNLHLSLTLDHSLDLNVFLDEKTVTDLKTLLSELQDSGKLRKTPLAH
jgi:hypothetical protein